MDGIHPPLSEIYEIGEIGEIGERRHPLSGVI